MFWAHFCKENNNVFLNNFATSEQVLTAIVKLVLTSLVFLLQAHPLFSELEELIITKEGELEWKETAR